MFEMTKWGDNARPWAPMFEWKVWMRFNNLVGRGLVDLRSHPKGKTDQIHNDLYWLKAVSGWCWNQNTCICIRNLSFLLGMLPVTVTTKDDIRTSLVQVGLPKSLYFLLPSWEWWLVSPVFAPKFFKSSIFTSILGWRDGGIDPPTLTARRWWLGAGRSDPWELGSFKKCGGWGPNLFTKKPGAVFEAQPDSGRKAGGKMKHPNWNRNFELWTMFFLGWNFLVVYKLHLRVWGFNYSVITAWKKRVFWLFLCISSWPDDLLKEAETAPVQGGKGGICLRITNALAKLWHLFERTSRLWYWGS